jgi:hypothetical protein
VDAVQSLERAPELLALVRADTAEFGIAASTQTATATGSPTLMGDLVQSDHPSRVLQHAFAEFERQAREQHKQQSRGLSR